MFAKVINNKVILLVEEMPVLHPDAAKFYFPCKDDVKVGFVFDGKNFTTPPRPSNEELLIKIRKERDILIALTDWTQLSDVSLSAEKKMEFANYRKLLRDFPASCDPQNPSWPKQPEV